MDSIILSEGEITWLRDILSTPLREYESVQDEVMRNEILDILTGD